MLRRPVSSSNIASVGWAENVLEVEFTSGALYRYSGVPESDYQALIGAGSVGRYLNQHIIPNFEGQRV